MVWDGMNVEVDPEAIYMISGVRLANILRDVATLRNLYSGGGVDLDGRRHELIDPRRARRGLIRALADSLVGGVEPDDDPLDLDDDGFTDDGSA